MTPTNHSALDAHILSVFSEKKNTDFTSLFVTGSETLIYFEEVSSKLLNFYGELSVPSPIIPQPVWKSNGEKPVGGFNKVNPIFENKVVFSDSNNKLSCYGLLGLYASTTVQYIDKNLLICNEPLLLGVFPRIVELRANKTFEQNIRIAMKAYLNMFYGCVLSHKSVYQVSNIDLVREINRNHFEAIYNSELQSNILNIHTDECTVWGGPSVHREIKTALARFNTEFVEEELVSAYYERIKSQVQYLNTNVVKYHRYKFYN